MVTEPAPCPHKARVGQCLRGKWRLERLLGVGGTAAVYAAVHRNGMRGAVKILHPELRNNPESRARFLYEGVVANRVKHDGIVSILDDDVIADGTPFLVMELLDGEAVDERMSRSPGRRLGVDDACRIVYRLLDVLAAAHAAGVTHRDVKPENVLLTRDGRVKLIDFGIAHVEGCPAKRVMTRFGYTMGTPGFMPPEQATGDWENVGPASDLWAVGATLYNMLTGELVHGDTAVYKLLQRTATEPAPPISGKVPELPAEIATIADKALSFEIPDRFSSARAMRAALVAAWPASSTGFPPRRSQPPPATPPKLELLTTTIGKLPLRRRSTALIGAAVGSAVFGAGLLAWGASRSPAELTTAPPEAALEEAEPSDEPPLTDETAGLDLVATPEEQPVAAPEVPIETAEDGATGAPEKVSPAIRARKARDPSYAERVFRTRL